jgi:hypothetical protein
MVGLHRGEIEPGLGEQAVEEAGPVLHPLESGFHQCGQLGDVVFGEVGQGSFECDQMASTGLSSGTYGGSRKTVSQSRAAISSAIARLA